MREENWMLVEFYDDNSVELYDLAADVRESQNLADRQVERVRRMRQELADWRLKVNAQGNKPNPNFAPASFRKLYQDVDPSRFDPASANQVQWEQMWDWRKEMNAVLSRRVPTPETRAQ